MKRIKEMKKNQKGFTLVELIVVLVILAILAAMLVPALLGYIDRAKQGKYSEEVHSIYTALQVVNDERYAKGKTPLGGSDAITTDEKTEINAMIAPTNIADGNFASITYSYASTTDAHGKYTLNAIGNVTFKSQDNKTVTAKIDGASVVLTKIVGTDGTTVEYESTDSSSTP